MSKKTNKPIFGSGKSTEEPNGQVPTPANSARPIQDRRSELPESEQPDSELSNSKSEGSNVGQTDHFKLFEEIARGGMGSVIKGRDLHLKRDLAVKVLLDSRDETTVQRFFEEAQISGQLQHPGIVPVYEVGRLKDSRPYFAMKLVKGKTLRELLDERSNPEDDRQRFLGIFEQVCQTVAYTHSRRVIHRDLKPANIMVGAFGEVQVMDWGVAKVLSDDESRDEPDEQIEQDVTSARTCETKILTVRNEKRAAAHTNDGVVFGTLAYMSPEQAMGDKDGVAEPTDVFGLGAILCEILTGSPPYQGQTTKKLFRMATRGQMADVWSRLDECSADVELIELAKSCLEYEPEARPANAGVVAEEMTNYFKSVDLRLRESELEHAKQFEEKKRRKVKLALVGTLITSMLLGAVALVWLQMKQVEFEQAKRIAAEVEVKKQTELAIIEEKAKRSAQLAQNREQQLRQESETLKQETEWNLSDVCSDRGVTAGDSGDAGTAIMWFARAAKLAGPDETRKANNLIRANNWARSAAIPVGAIKVSGRPMSMDFQPAGSLLLTHFTPLKYTFREALKPSTVFKNQSLPELEWLEEVEMPSVIHTKHQTLFTVFDWKSNKEVSWLDQKENPGVAIWSPDGLYLATGRSDGVVQIRNTKNGVLKKEIIHEGEITALAYSDDGSQLAIAGATLRIWDLKKDKFHQNGSWKPPTEIHSLTFNQDGSLLAAVALDSVARIFSTEDSSQSQEPVFRFPHLYLYAHSLIDRRHPAVWLMGEDGQRRIAGVCGKNEYAIWDVDLGTVVQKVRSENFGVGEMHATQDSQLVVAGDEVCQVRSGPNYSNVKENGFHSDTVTSAKMSSDGKILFTGSLDTTAQLWSAADGSPLGPVMNHASGVGEVDVSDDQTWLATATMNGLIRVWNHPLVQESQELDTSIRSRVACFSPDGRFVVAGKSDGSWADFRLELDQFNVFDPQTGQPIGPAIKPNGKTDDICFDSSSQSVIAVHHDAEGLGFVSSYNLKTNNQLIETIPLTASPIWVASHPSKPLVAVMCKDSQLNMIDMEHGKSLYTKQFDSANDWYCKIRFTPDGKKIVVCSHEYFQALDAISGVACFDRVKYSNANRENCVMAISPDSETIAVSSSNSAMFWSLATAEEIGTPLAHTQTSHYLGAVVGMEFSPDSKHLITACFDHYARLWDWRTGKQVCPPMQHSGPVHCAVFTPDGNYAVTGSQGKECGPHLWELKTGMRVAPSWKAASGEEDCFVHSVSVSQDGRNLFATVHMTGDRKPLYRYEFGNLRTQSHFSIQQLKQIGELTSSKRFTLGRSENLPQATWLKLWEQFSKRNPQFSCEVEDERKLR